MTTKTETKYAVWKYDVPIKDSFELEIPKYGRILALKTQKGKPNLWILVNPTNEKETRYFYLAGTGEPVSQDIFNGKFVGTFLIADDYLVFHLFELFGIIKAN